LQSDSEINLAESQEHLAASQDEKDNSKSSNSTNDDDMSTDDLSALVQQALGRDRYGDQELGNLEDFGTNAMDIDLVALMGSAFRGFVILNRKSEITCIFGAFNQSFLILKIMISIVQTNTFNFWNDIKK